MISTLQSCRIEIVEYQDLINSPTIFYFVDNLDYSGILSQYYIKYLVVKLTINKVVFFIIHFSILLQSLYIRIIGWKESKDFSDLLICLLLLLHYELKVHHQLHVQVLELYLLFCSPTSPTSSFLVCIRYSPIRVLHQVKHSK